MVILGTDVETKQEVAMKLTHIRDSPEALEYEAGAYAALSGETGIPRVMWFGQEGDYYVLVHELLGPSLEDLLNYCGRKFSLKTVLLIADQAIRRLKQIHDNGYLHCDIKPDNFLLGVGTNGNVLYTIDFGLARDFDATDGLGARDNRPLGGTNRYASLNNHNGLSESIFVTIALKS
jgi:casein kinase 1 delta/casein kinase I family protein HRR25